MAKNYFVTATGTDIGKTYVCEQILRNNPDFKALKPIMSGFDPKQPENSDAARLLRAMQQPEDLQAIQAFCPWLYAAALTPSQAAVLEDRPVDFAQLIYYCKSELALTDKSVLLEGVGGLMAPITEQHTCLDWLKALKLPALVITGSYLGALSHTFTTLETLKAHNCEVAAVIVSETKDSTVGLDDTITTLKQFTKVPIIKVAYGDSVDISSHKII